MTGPGEDYFRRCAEVLRAAEAEAVVRGLPPEPWSCPESEVSGE